MTLSAIYYHHSNLLPIVAYSSSKENFVRVCETNQVDWAHLMNKETGEILHTYRNNTRTVSQPTSTISQEQSINRVER